MTKPLSSPKLFLAQLTLPVNRTMIRAAVECAAQVGNILSFDEADNYTLQVAVEEAVCNAIDHFSGLPGEDERVHLEFYVEAGLLIVSIREKGIPFNLSHADKYTPEDLEGMSKPGLGMLLMHKGMESVELFVHGREGKETRLTKKLAYGALPDSLRNRRSVKRKRETVKNYIIRPACIEELPDICQLAWKCYGYTQEKFLYDIDALTEKFASGEFKSIIAIDTDRNIIIGHVGLKYHDPAVKVSELGLAFVDPAFRCSGVSRDLGPFSRKIAMENGDAGIFDCSVTTHTFSQKAIQEYFGSSPCSLFLGIVVSDMEVKGLTVSKQLKGSTLNHYYAFDHSGKTIYIPQHHHKMVQEIYEWMDVPRSFGKPEKIAPSSDSSLNVFDLPDGLNVSFLIVNNIGENSFNEIEEAFQQCRRSRKDAVYAFLPSGVPFSPYLVEQLEKRGFSFAGIMPHIHNGDDRIILQWVDVPLDMDAIHVYGDRARRLFSYIKDELKRVDASI
ncbi:ATP-binding protein [Maridesulfovibrio hydrothermalis]|uniref:N-acetyltransferase domain-containing protein n=1 Tax=Maridesulfovibrio hydrothermalis AM13 = DSM 14728 TaxID=1121451 RepID=L0RFX9_9BACT|nr:ATP-binding protein [Maridesulfovibrio hydrothermalis]CCO24451.1 protein of unknown function [Maridesulfovibrio hydrothermalis AM13 = DSM 14728]